VLGWKSRKGKLPAHANARTGQRMYGKERTIKKNELGTKRKCGLGSKNRGGGHRN